MKTSVEFVNHASVIIKSGRVAILCDPWFKGDVFHKGWDLISQTSDKETDKILDKISHIWISHEHPDHFSIPFFKENAKKIIENSIKILFQETKDKRVLKFFKSQFLDCTELKFNKKTYLSDDLSVSCIKDGFYDSALLVTNRDEKILNLNDCEVTTPSRVKEVLKVTGEVDVLLTQFSFAAWKGGKSNKKWRTEAAEEKINTIALQIKYFRPKFIIPFASFIYFSNEENFYLNDSINSPSKIWQKFKKNSSQVLIMKPLDIIGGDFEEFSTERALEFWDQKYTDLKSKHLNKYQKIDQQEILESFTKYCKRVAENNNVSLIKLIRTFSPITVFRPVIVKVTDLGLIFKFDYVTKKIEQTTEDPMLSMTSESLDFLFKNSFGFDTLTVNGCFEECSKGGFVTSAKTLAIENLNNLGIFVVPSTLFNFSIIKLFLKRLYRVARKLNT